MNEKGCILDRAGANEWSFLMVPSPFFPSSETRTVALTLEGPEARPQPSCLLRAATTPLPPVIWA